MLPFGVTVQSTVPQRSEILEGLTNYPVLVSLLHSSVEQFILNKVANIACCWETRATEHLTNTCYWTPHKHMLLNTSQTCYWTPHKHVLLNASQTCATEPHKHVLLNTSQTRATEHLTNMCYWTPHTCANGNNSQTRDTEQLTNMWYWTTEKHWLWKNSGTIFSLSKRELCVDCWLLMALHWTPESQLIWSYWCTLRTEDAGTFCFIISRKISVCYYPENMVYCTSSLVGWLVKVV